MTKVLVLGAAGMLGHKLCQLLPAQGFNVTAAVRWREDRRGEFPGVFEQVQLVTNVDALQEGAIEAVITDVLPHVVVNCIGIIKQRHEAQDPFLSVAVNSLLPHRLARLCAQQDCRLIHISTDCVFDGTRGGYREADFCTARDLYGQSKHLGETTDTEPCAVTLRTSIVGRELIEPGYGLLEWLLAQREARVRGFSKAIFSGLTTHELSRVIGRVIAKGADLCGVYHVASAPLSKHDLLRMLRDAYGLDMEIVPDEQVVCDRSLCMDRFAARMGYQSPSWEAMVAEMQIDQTPYWKWKSNCAAQLVAPISNRAASAPVLHTLS